MSGSVRRGVCGREAGPSGPRAWRAASAVPARATFLFPKLLHTQQEGSFPRSLLQAPLVFVLVVGGCLLIFFFFWFPGQWVMISIFTEDKKQPFLRLGGRHIPHHPFKLGVD